MKLSRKLPLAIAGALFLASGAGLFGIYKLNQATAAYARVIEVDYTNEDIASTILTNFKQQVQEWKDTLLRGKDPAAFSKYWGNFEKQEKAVADDARKLIDTLPEGETRALITQFVEAHARMGVAYRKGLEAFKAANFEPTVGDVAVKGIDRAPTDLLRLAREKIVAGTKASVAEAGRTSSAATMGSLVLMLIVVLLGSVGGLTVSRQVIRQLGGDPAEARQVARRVAAGELDFSIAVATGHEKSLLAALEVMVRQLTSVVQGIHQSSDSVDVASREIAAGNRNLSSRTEQQAASVEETASAMEELTSTVKETAANAEEANRLASSASRVAERGLRAVNSAVTTIQEIAASSKQIEDIIQVIDSIAFQTNILALNAAVEAARAGNSGRGFAVVASEVRNLAQRSAGAAREIKGLITASTAKAGQGASLATEAGKEVQAIVQEVKRLSTTISEISSAAHEQAAGIELVNKAIVQLDEVTQQNAALVEEATAAASSLQEQAKNMVRAVGAFKLPGAPSHAAQTGAHVPALQRRNIADVEEAAADRAPDSPVAERAGLTRAA